MQMCEWLLHQKQNLQSSGSFLTVQAIMVEVFVLFYFHISIISSAALKLLWLFLPIFSYMHNNIYEALSEATFSKEIFSNAQ